MCKVSEINIHWCWRYSYGGTKFSNILSILANKNGEFDRDETSQDSNACVKYREKIFIGVGDIQTDRQILDGRTDQQTDEREDGAQIIIFFF